VTSHPPPFQVSEKKLDKGAYLLVVRGELDISVASKFRELVAATPPDVTTLVMDLSELEFIDSSGLQVLLEEQKRLDASGGKLVIVSADPKMHDLFRLTGVDKMCTVVSSRTEAVEASLAT
jgi:stage II sporulation protein AA (anti-sigma F factor antagonist)